MIGYYRKSLVGRSHLSENAICQDSSGVKALSNGWVVGVIADGVGSAKHSDLGSSLAVEEVLCFVEENVPETWHEESLISLLRTAYHSAFKKIKEKASQDKNLIADYDTTLTSVIYNGTNLVFGHVGDGGVIALNHYGDFSVLTVAQKGEAFNEVFPLRAGPDIWLFGASNEPIAALLMLTDGVYDIACPWLLAKQNQKIYVNYVRPFMDRNILPVKTTEDFHYAQKIIEEFLMSGQSRMITDDKTVLGIINTDILPEIKSDDYYLEPHWKRLKEDHDEKLYGSKSFVTKTQNDNACPEAVEKTVIVGHGGEYEKETDIASLEPPVESQKQKKEAIPGRKRNVIPR